MYRSGKYTKIGNVVEIEILMSWSSFNGTGSIQISGLPFAQVFGRTLYFAVGEHLNYEAAAQLLGLTYSTFAIGLYQNTSNGVIGMVSVDDACDYFLINGKYFTNS